VGGVGGPRERVVGRVGGVSGIWYRHIPTTETEKGERLVSLEVGSRTRFLAIFLSKI
jgi:hypothetical protein